MDSSNILFRSSGLSQLLTDPQGKSPKEKYFDAVSGLDKARIDLSNCSATAIKTADKLKEKISSLEKLVIELEPDKDKELLSATAMSFIAQTVRGLNWGRQESFSSKQTEKGNLAEGDSVTLYTRVKKLGMIYQNKAKLADGFISGHPDPMREDGTILPFDIKTSWDWTTFPYKGKVLDSVYEWQNRGYMRLTEQPEWTTAYCLVNTPPELIEKERTALWYKAGCPNKSSDKWREVAAIHERNSIYDMEAFNRYLARTGVEYEFYFEGVWDGDIPMDQRVMEFTTKFDSEKNAEIEIRVQKARQFIKENY